MVDLILFIFILLRYDSLKSDKIRIYLLSKKTLTANLYAEEERGAGIPNFFIRVQNIDFSNNFFSFNFCLSFFNTEQVKMYLKFTYKGHHPTCCIGTSRSSKL